VRFFILSLVLISMSLIGVSSTQAADTLNLRSTMTAEDYAASGLDKLSDAERANLSEWIQRYRDGALNAPPSPEQKAEQKVEEEKEFVGILANVIPKFTGWSGKTIFQLDNGQIWKQRIGGNDMRYSGDDYRVTITKNWIGKYSMKHVETGRSVPVQRIK